MTVTFDTGYDDTTETKTDFVQISDLYRLGGREVKEEIILNHTDQKTELVIKRAMSGGIQISGKVGIEGTFGGNGNEIRVFVDTQMKDKDGNKVIGRIDHDGENGNWGIWAEASATFNFDPDYNSKTGAERD